MTLREKIQGLILVASLEDKRRIINEIEPEWFSTSFDKAFFEIVSEMLDQNIEIDIISVLDKFKERGLFEKTLPYKLSEISGGIMAGTFLEVNQTLALLRYENSIKAAKKSIQQIDELLNSGNFTEDQFLKITEAAKDKMCKKTQLEENSKDIFLEVLDQHERAANGEEIGLSFPFNNLRSAVVLEPVDFMVIGARPAMGKTAFAVSLALRYAMQGRNVVLFALEMSKQQVMRRIIGNIFELDTLDIKLGKLNKNDLETLNNAIEEITPLLNRITIFDGSHNCSQIENALFELKGKKKIDIFIVDYLQKIQSAKKTRYEQVTEVSNRMKIISQQMKIPSIAFAQLSRDSGKSGKLPSLPDLRESGEIEQDASVVAFLHRPEYYGEPLTSEGRPAFGICEFLIAKNREGIVDVFELEVELKYSKFKEISNINRFTDVDYTDANF